MKDMLILISDQHEGRVMAHAGDKIVRTPNLDRLAEDGTVFQRAYTACPLCVPALMSMLTGRLPAHTGVYTNKGSIHSDMPTFLHSLANAGYETVLCGRMHFEGADQRHGFTKRIAGDITSTAVGPAEDSGHDMGPYWITMADPGCLKVIGGGNSVTLEYDRYVVAEAVKYLSCDHEKPQCVVVGTYAPHFPYVAPKELYDYYFDKVSIPPTVDREAYPPHPAAGQRQIDTDPDIVRAVRAAYCGMVEFTDQCVGAVRGAWEEYLTRQNREGVFVYLSDHGDHAGDRGYYGKQSLYEASVRIPLIVQGDGILAGSRIASPVSIVDIAPTICGLAEADPLPGQDGVSLLPALTEGKENPDRAVISEWITNPYFKGTDYGRMVTRGDWKLITYADYPDDDLLTRPTEDFWELKSYKEQFSEIAAELREIAYNDIDPAKIVADKNSRDAGYDVVAAFNKKQGAVNTDMWREYGEGKLLPKQYVSSENPLLPFMQPIWDLRLEQEENNRSNNA